jgi:hypothetical protein
MPKAPQSDSGAVAGPDTIYVPDKDGKLKPVIGFSYEDFIRARGILHQVDGGQEEPAYVLEALQLNGEAAGNRAELVLTAKILITSDRWTQVPLGLTNSVLRGRPEVTGAREHFLHFNQQAAGFVLWLKGKPKTQVQLKLDLLRQIEQTGDESTLRLSLARANAASFSIEVDTPSARGRISDRGQLDSELGEPGASKDSTRFAGQGVHGDFFLAWRAADQGVREAPPAFEATGEILVQVDSHTIRNSAKLTVRSFRGQFDRFRVKLPRGAELVDEPRSSYTIVAIDSDVRHGQTVEVQIPRKTAGPVEVQIVSRQLREKIASNKSVELAGFQVLGAVRQWGHLAIEVSGDWQLLLGAMRNVRQVQEVPEGLQRDDLFAGFEYYSQPFALAVRIVQRTSRVRVEAEHVVLVSPSEARLSSKLRYAVRGSKIFALDIRLPGWEIDTIGPANLVTVENVVADADGTVNARLLQPASGDLEITLTARRSIDADQGEVSFSIPSPDATSQTPAAVVIVPDDNLELVPLADRMVGLSAAQFTPSQSVPDRQKTPLLFHSDQQPAQFAAAVEVRLQTIAVEATSKISLGPSEARFRQSFEYSVEFEPVEQFSFVVPRELAGRGKLLLTFDGQPLAVAAVLDDGFLPDTGVERIRATLPAPPRIGRVEISAEYTMPLDSLPPEQSTLISLPLVMPVEGKLDRNVASVTSEAGVRVAYRQGEWRVDESAPRTNPGELRVVADKHLNTLPLAVSLEEKQGLQATVIEQAWFQSWLTQSVRQDRACFRVVTGEDAIDFELPTSIDPHEVEVLVDRVVTDAVASGERNLTVALPRQATPDSRVVELRYHREVDEAPLRFEAPRVLGDAWVQHIYWQLILPSDTYLVANPAGLTCEFEWAWNGVFWGRRPLLAQSQLESLCGATSAPAPPSTTNQYLFSTLGIPDSDEVRTAGRTTIVTLAAGFVLLVGLLLLYWPPSRHPGVLFGAAVVLLAVGLRFPEVALVIAQVSALGLALVIAAALLRLLVSRSRGKPVATPGSSIGFSSRASTQPYEPASMPVSASSAATAISLPDEAESFLGNPASAESGITQ